MTSPDFPTPSMDPRRGDAIESILRATVADDADARRTTRSHRRTRGILIASIATACVVVAGGLGYAATRGSVTAPHGGGGVAVPTSGPSSKPSATTKPTGSGAPVIVDPAGTATPVPTPTPTPNTPTDVDTWKITTDGIGPLEIGMQITAADSVATGAGLTITTCGAVSPAPTHFYERADGLQFNILVGYDRRVEGIALSTAGVGAPVTPHGIGIGSSEAQLKATYPGLTAPKFPLYPGETGYALSDGAGHWIDFAVDDAKSSVFTIIVSTTNEVPGEFCG